MPIDINLTYRANLVSPLTWAQGDANFKTLADNDVFLNDAVEVAQATADSAVTNANGRQPVNAKLTAIAAQVWAANQMLYLTGANSLETRPVNEYGVGLLNYDSAVTFKTALSLQNVNNTSDANKPISTATQTAIDSVISNTATDLSDLESEIQTKLDLKMNSSQRGVANGVASLGSDTKVPAAQLPLGTANGAASLGADGKLPVSQLPPLAVNEVFTVASQAAMLALTAERGDVAVRSDQTGLAYILASDDPTVLANWKPLDQALSVSLAALNVLTPAADRIPIFTGAATAALQIVTTLGKSLMAIADASAARLAILAAKSGANSDITSLDSLTTPLSVSQGGTGVNSISAAQQALGIAPFNYIFNGKMQVAQFGASFAGLTNTTANTLDRWRCGVIGPVVTVAQESITWSNPEFQNGLSVTVTTSATMTAAQFGYLLTILEGSVARRLVGKSFVLTFEVSSPVAGVHCVAFRNGATADRSYVAEYTIVTANTPQTVSVYVPAGLITAGTWNWQNGDGLFISWSLGAGTNFQTATPNTWVSANALATANQVNACANAANKFIITGVRLGEGSTPIAFPPTPYADDLRNCQRWAYRCYPTMMGIAIAPTLIGRAGQPHPVTMRSAPTAVSPANVDMWDGSLLTNGAITSNYSTATFLEGDFTQGGGSFTTGRPGKVFSTSSSRYIDVRTD